MTLTSALLRAAKRAAERLRGSERLLCARMKCLWYHPQRAIPRGWLGHDLARGWLGRIAVFPPTYYNMAGTPLPHIGVKSRHVTGVRGNTDQQVQCIINSVRIARFIRISWQQYSRPSPSLHHHRQWCATTRVSLRVVSVCQSSLSLSQQSF